MPRLAHHVGRTEPVAAQHVHRHIFVHPLAVPRLAAQGHVVHRYFREAVLSQPAHVFRAQGVLVCEVAVAVGVHRSGIHYVAKVCPHCGLAQFQGTSFVAEIVGVEHLAGLFVEQLAVAGHKLHVQLPHTFLEGLAVGAPQRHNQVLGLDAHLAAVVVADGLAHHRGVTLRAICLEHPPETVHVANLGAGVLLPLQVVPLHCVAVPLAHFQLAAHPRPFGALGLQPALESLQQACAVGVLFYQARLQRAAVVLAQGRVVRPRPGVGSGLVCGRRLALYGAELGLYHGQPLRTLYAVEVYKGVASHAPVHYAQKPVGKVVAVLAVAKAAAQPLALAYHRFSFVLCVHVYSSLVFGTDTPPSCIALRRMRSARLRSSSFCSL